MNIHILCDSPKTLSGFSRVGRNLFKGLTKLGHFCCMTGFQTSYESEFFEDNSKEVLPINTQYIDEITQYIINVQKSKAELTICIFNADDASQNMFAKAMSPTIWYVPVEGKKISSMMTRDLLHVSEKGKIIAQCNWGHNELKNNKIKSEVIYHGYDEKIFRKLNKNEFIKKELTNEKINILKYTEGKWLMTNTNIHHMKNELDNKFIFGFVGANHGIRKRIERLLESYALFLQKNIAYKKETLLILRTMPISITGIDLIKECNDLGISPNVIFLYGDNNRLSDNMMNVIYNTFDVNVSASSSEGFGFATLESMAVGVPQIGPDCSSFIELIGKDDDTRGLISIDGMWQMIPDGSKRYLVNEYDMSLKMEIMYLKDDFREVCSNNSLEFAQQYTWNKVIKQWNDLLNESEFSKSKVY